MDRDDLGRPEVGSHCPVPMVWNEIYRGLLTARERSGDPSIPKPPVPLILNGWVFSSDSEKFLRWQQTVAWAERHGFSEQIPRLPDDQLYGHGDDQQ